MKEKAIEEYFVKHMQQCGALCYKFTSPGTDGVPDRIVILPGGAVLFVEVKADGGVLSAIQKREHDRLRAQGASVYTLTGISEVQTFCQQWGCQL